MRHLHSRILPALLVVLGFTLSACTGEALESQSVDANAESEQESSEQNATASSESSAAPAQQQTAYSQSTQQRSEPTCYNCGTIASIEPVSVKGEGSGAGAIGGAILGGVIGHQIGGGSGKKIATVAGAMGGGYAGHKAEEKIRSDTIHRVTIRMEQGGTRVIDMADASYLQPGQRVRVDGNSVSVR